MFYDYSVTCILAKHLRISVFIGIGRGGYTGGESELVQTEELELKMNVSLKHAYNDHNFEGA